MAQSIPIGGNPLPPTPNPNSEVGTVTPPTWKESTGNDVQYFKIRQQITKSISAHKPVFIAIALILLYLILKDK